MLSREERAKWVRRGYKDPKRAYAEHAVRAARRGIAFELTFQEWWGIWEPHYEKRGRGADQLGMCRTGDRGPYAAGNVRLDTPKGNAQESALERLTTRGRVTPAYRQITPPAKDSWLWRRNVFSQYCEDDDEESA